MTVRERDQCHVNYGSVYYSISQPIGMFRCDDPGDGGGGGARTRRLLANKSLSGVLRVPHHEWNDRTGGLVNQRETRRDPKVNLSWASLYVLRRGWHDGRSVEWVSATEWLRV